MPRTVYAYAGAAGLVAALGVAHQRIGLAFSVLLLLLLASATAAAAEGGRRPLLVGIGVALALQPVLRDAGWVICVDVVAVLAGAGAVVTPPRTWRSLARALAAPRGSSAARRSWVGRRPHPCRRRGEAATRAHFVASDWPSRWSGLSERCS